MALKDRTFNIEIPFFPGFYESEFEYSDLELNLIEEEIENLRCEYDIKEGDIIFDYESRRKDIIVHFINHFADYMPELIEDFDNSELRSPKEYNFSTDRIFANVILCKNWENIIKEF